VQVRAFNWLVDQGLAFYWGTSEWTSQQLQEVRACARHAMHFITMAHMGMHAGLQSTASNASTQQTVSSKR